MHVSLKILDDYVKKGLITKSKHPEFDLWIYNYTRECQYDRKWDAITRMCRGLIVDASGTVIGRPFEKFFNPGELDYIPESDDYKIYEKLDGVLIIVCTYKDNLIVASRGSFTSPYANLAKSLIEKNPALLSVCKTPTTPITFLFELTGPASKIILVYKENKLTLLASIYSNTGKEIDLVLFRKSGIDIVKEWQGKERTIEELRNLNISGIEGFVLKWSDGFRLKVKFLEYINLHKLIVGCNEKIVWEWLRDEKDLNELLNKVPEEFKNWVNEISEGLYKKFFKIYDDCITFIGRYNLVTIDRKKAALRIIEHGKKYQGVLFNLLDNREEEAEKVIWKLIKPKIENNLNAK